MTIVKCSWGDMCSWVGRQVGGVGEPSSIQRCRLEVNHIKFAYEKEKKDMEVVHHKGTGGRRLQHSSNPREQEMCEENIRRFLNV